MVEKTDYDYNSSIQCIRHSPLWRISSHIEMNVWIYEN